jgi:uncharacterized membrane protein
MHHTIFSKSFLRSKLLTTEIFFYGFLFFYFAVLIYLCKAVPLWEDEFYSLNTTSGRLSEVVNQSYSFEAQPPVYFVLLKLWRLIDDGAFFARFLSVLSVGAAALVFVHLVRLISGSKSAGWVIALFLLNPFTVWAALEIRTYALLLLLSVATIYFFMKYLTGGEKKYIFSFLIISLIGLYTQYLFVFLIISLSLALLLFKGWRSFFDLCLFMIPLVLLFLPNLLFLHANIGNQQTDNPVYTFFYSLIKVGQSPPKLLLGLNRLPFEDWVKVVVIIIFAGIVLYTYILTYKNHLLIKDSFLNNFNFLLVSGLIFIALYLIVFTLSKIAYSDLYMTIAFPLFTLIYLLFRSHPSLYKYLLYYSFSIYFIILLILTYKHPVKFYDFISITKYVNAIEHSGEPILLYRNGLSLPFGYYYKGSNSLYPLPGKVSFDKNYLINIKDSLELKQLIQNIKTLSKTYLLISDDNANYLYSVNMNREMLNDYLSHNFRTISDTSGFGDGKELYIRIRRLEKIQSNQ